jgi:hypothetical protein
MPVVVACSCGANLRVPDTAAGKRVKCPKCGELLTVPAPQFEVIDDAEDEAPRPARRAAVKAKPAEVDEPIDDDEGEEEEERPKKKAKGKRKGNKAKGKNREQEKKKRLITLIVGICGAVFVLGAVGVVVAIVMNTQDPAKAGISTTPAAKPSLPSGWSVFKGDGFSVGVPDAVQFRQQDQVANPAGLQGGPTVQGKVYTNGAQPQPGQAATAYVVNAAPLPPEIAAEFAKSQQAGWEAIKKIGGPPAQLQNEKAIQVSGVEGRQYTVSAGFVAGVVRVAVKGDKLYTWAVMAKAAPPEDGPEAKPFFDSFKLD